MRAFAVIALLAVTWLTGCAPKARPALSMPRDEFIARIRTICLSPVTAEFNLSDGGERFQTVETAIAAALSTNLFTVVRSDKVLPLVKWVMETEQGYFDRYTGRRDEAKYRFIRSRMMHELKAQLGCDAVLYPALVQVTAFWSEGTAHWDGVTDKLGSGWGASGQVGALSLWVRVRNLDDEEIYFGTGGVQVVHQLKTGFFTASFELVEEQALLQDPIRITIAAQASLQPLITPSASKHAEGY